MIIFSLLVGSIYTEVPPKCSMNDYFYLQTSKQQDGRRLAIDTSKKNKPKRALIIFNPTDMFYSRCFGEQPFRIPSWEKSADHLLGPINALRKWSRNYTEGGESFFDITIFTRLKYSASSPYWKSYSRNGKNTYQHLCNLEGLAIFPSKTEKLPRCCIYEDQINDQPQGNDIFKGKMCGCPEDEDLWGDEKQCSIGPEHYYFPYFSIVEHGDVGITTWIDGPKGEDQGDYVINTRYDFMHGGSSGGGLFFEHNYTSETLDIIFQEGGKHLQKPTYEIFQKHNITELYFSGYGDTGIRDAIGEIPLLQHMNLNATLISDAFDGGMYTVHNSTHEERRQQFFKELQDLNVNIKTSHEIVKEAYQTSDYNKTFKIDQPSCTKKKVTELKRALLILDLQEGFLSSCEHSNITSNTMIPDSHRLVPRINAFYQWIYTHQHQFFQIHISQRQTVDGVILNELDYPLAKKILYKMKMLYSNKEKIDLYFSQRNETSFFSGIVTSEISKSIHNSTQLSDSLNETSSKPKNLSNHTLSTLEILREEKNYSIIFSWYSIRYYDHYNCSSCS